ncbi:TIGR04222 domain-containing membrane protein [Candidatus Laterigemmans baculatus]|uniref:TIGR04222 domain-containing membrane protein n=1 Tax=Candidatus Laterigemmans baculatus TaxID=2770505 RepID=UPI0013DA98E1|nr:TIGR04222 domain-containing membrane protein [Candidatus Laterigemmans baculatus]
MNESLKEYVARVEAFEIDSDSKTLRFVDRLARENRWTVGYASRVVREYLRFCILAMRSGHPVTPSEDVDQAWHLHLTYTRSYWERFCGETLGSPLHHEPTAGGPEEGGKFRDWYQATLDSYRRVFESEPPQDIWPPTAQRFAHAGEFRWMNAGREWAIPKRLTLVGGGAIACCIAGPPTSLVVANALAGEVATTPAIGFIFPFNISGTAFLIFYAAFSLLGLIAMLALRISRSVSQDHDPRIGEANKLSTDELAVLAGGGSRLAHVALTRLFADRRIEASKRLWWYSSFKVVGAPPTQPAIDRDLYSAIASGKPTSELMEIVKPHFEHIEARLEEKGLRHPYGQQSRAGTWIAVFIGAIGGLRLVQGLALGEEIGYLLAMMLVFAIAAIGLNIRRSRTTPRGKEYLEHAKSLIETGASRKSNPEPAMLAMSVALLGTSAVAGIEGFTPLASLAPSVGRGSSTGGCGAGCSGCGGGGCGGGGCGGCGG